MLVSSIARFQAINTMNNASFANVQTANSMVNSVNNTHAFEGDLEDIHGMDNRLGLAFWANSLLCKISFLQEKMFAKIQKDEFEPNKVNYVA